MDSHPGNASFRASQIRPPGSRLPAPNMRPGTLTEFSESQSNARAQTTMPPPASGIKRPQSGHARTAAQPDAKQRKTLAERAVEYPSSATPAPRTLNKGVSLASQSGIKPPSTTIGPSRHQSSASMSSVHSRNTGAFANSVGPGIGRSNSVMTRSKTAMSFQHPTSTSAKQPANTRVRPQTAMSARNTEDPPSPEKQNSWDMDVRLIEVEAQFKQMKEVMNISLKDKTHMEEVIEMAKARANDLERDRRRLDEKNTALQDELDLVRQQMSKLTVDLDQERRSHKYELEDCARAHRDELQELRKVLTDDSHRLSRQHEEDMEALKRQHRIQMEEQQQHTAQEIGELRVKLGSEQQDLAQNLKRKDHEIQEFRNQVEALGSDLEIERTQKGRLQKQLDELIDTNTTLEGTIRSLKAQVHYLESGREQQSESFAEMEARLQEAIKSAEYAREKLIKEETERRVLFNKYQELKGNIRVMCRVRPVLDNSEGNTAELDYPDEKTSSQIAVKGPELKSAMGKVSTNMYPFEFDRVFAPQVHNEEIFDEISQLVQSALDGYNVCIFCYGQTGSGKTYTMSSADGMIPRATKMIYETVGNLKDKSWIYTMEGTFIEVYNEELHDLLTPPKEQDPKKKPDIKHDEIRKTTTVTNCKSVMLDSEDTVELMLNQAQKNRSVAATKSNEQSSRSHSVFTLKLIGKNSATGEQCEGTLNLVDLAGSERLKVSGAEGDRMKETQNINTSLKSLGDVIEALGTGRHVPYRNSKLTYLLRYSLGGNSKTLMFVMVSPLEAHLNETLSSLRFATKVHNTHIGTAKSTKKSKSDA